MFNDFEEIPAWVNCDSFGSELDKENEWNDTDDILQARYPLDADEAREKFEGMAEYTE